MSSTIRRPVQLLAVLLVALLAFPVFDVFSADTADAATRKDRKIERRLHNQVRKAHGRRPVRLHPRLNRIAKRHSLRMARQDRLYHNPRLVRQVRRFRRLGENVGVATNMGRRRTLRTLHRAFMKSRPHRRNVLLRPFRHMGVGIVRRSGKVWITVVFRG